MFYVVPAQARTQSATDTLAACSLDSRLRGNDGPGTPAAVAIEPRLARGLHVEHAFDLFGPIAPAVDAVLLFAARGFRAGEVGPLLARFVDQVVVGVIGVEEVQGDARAVAIAGVGAGAVGRAVAEERDAAGLEFDGTAVLSSG